MSMQYSNTCSGVSKLYILYAYIVSAYGNMGPQYHMHTLYTYLFEIKILLQASSIHKLLGTK